jgi:hypothetical protein
MRTVFIALCVALLWAPLTLGQSTKQPPNSAAATRVVANQAAGNGQNFDPTANVLNLVDASIKRIDDLRAAESKRIDDLRQLEKELRILADKRIDDLMLAESRRVNEQAVMRDVFYEKQRDSEALRINAIRAVDVGAVATANERATQTANTLATQVSQTAETARSLVASSATSIAAAQSAFATAINERITNLEKLQNQNQGQNAPAQVRENTAQIAAIQKTQNESVGKGSGLDAAWVYLIGFITLLGAILAIGSRFLRAQPPQMFYDRPRHEPVGSVSSTTTTTAPAPR